MYLSASDLKHTCSMRLLKRQLRQGSEARPKMGQGHLSPTHTAVRCCRALREARCDLRSLQREEKRTETIEIVMEILSKSSFSSRFRA